MSEQDRHDEIPHLEADETVPPRPEEEVADVARAEPATGAPGASGDASGAPGPTPRWR